MAKRIYRELPVEVRQKISDAMKRHHQEMSIDTKRAANKKRSESQKRYWSSIPHKQTGVTHNNATMQDIML
ncbi:MAG: hypothetical protein IIV55_02640 [Alistipes sp.]|nr:hypothetical protein [Alistipes sp.]